MKISPAVLTVSLADYLQFFTQCALSAMINTLVTIIQKRRVILDSAKRIMPRSITE